MTYNLTDKQKNVLRWIIMQNRASFLDDEFDVEWSMEGAKVRGMTAGLQDAHPGITKGALDALVAAGLMLCTIRKGGQSIAGRPREIETSRRCTLTAKAFEAVDSDFEASDTSFVKYLSMPDNLTNLDEELVERSVKLLAAGGEDPKVWDTAVRNSMVILENRLRAVSGVSSRDVYGQKLVNKLFQQGGVLVDRLSDDDDRQGYRDLYAGIFELFRNEYTHWFKDPSPEDGGAIIVFVNLLLKMLEELRPVEG